MKFYDKDGKPVDDVIDDEELDKKIFFFDTYKFSEQCFDGFMMAYEAVSEYLMHIDTAINDSESFSSFIEDLIWMLDGMYDTVSESTIRGKVTERERSEFGSTPKIFDDSMLRTVYHVVIGSAVHIGRLFFCRYRSIVNTACYHYQSITFFTQKSTTLYLIS